MEMNYHQETPERCVKVMKKSGKLAIAVMGIALGVILLIFGSRVGEGEEKPSPNMSPSPFPLPRQVYKHQAAAAHRSIKSGEDYHENSNCRI